jgi:hypothetical protein
MWATSVKAANWLTHLRYDWESSVWGHWLRTLSSAHRLVHYDERASGMSDWDVDDVSFDAWVRDLETVVDAAGPWTASRSWGSPRAALSR